MIRLRHLRGMSEDSAPGPEAEHGHLQRDTFATEALAAGLSIFELSRVMGASVKEIDRTYGHLARDLEDAIRTRLEARTARLGVEQVSGSGDEQQS
jgi:hypothetical protein